MFFKCMTCGVIAYIWICHAGNDEGLYLCDETFVVAAARYVMCSYSALLRCFVNVFVL